MRDKSEATGRHGVYIRMQTFGGNLALTSASTPESVYQCVTDEGRSGYLIKNRIRYWHIVRRSLDLNEIKLLMMWRFTVN
jgi:hypothetical protein